MAFSFGFYNSRNYDRMYNSIQISQIFDGIILDGVFATVGDCFILKENEENDTVTVSTGRAWFDHTWNYNDADYPLVGFPSELIVDRIDAVVLDVHYDEEFRTNSIKWIKGSASATPQRPTLIKEPGHAQYPIAYVLRKANTPIISAADITNMVGTSECPFVTGPLEAINTDELLSQWAADWRDFVKDYEAAATEWREEQQADFLAFYTEFRYQMNLFKTTEQREFMDWFQGIKDIFGESAAGQIMLALQNLDEREFNHYYGLIGSTTNISKDGDDTIITTADELVSSTTRITKDTSGNTTITTDIVPKDGNYDYQSITTIVKSETGTDITTTYTSSAKKKISMKEEIHYG